MSADNAVLHRTHALLEGFNQHDCGCVTRGDGQQLTYCPRHNNRAGTHGHTRGKGQGP